MSTTRELAGVAMEMGTPRRQRHGYAKRRSMGMRCVVLALLVASPLLVVSCGSDEQANTSVVQPERIRPDEEEGPVNSDEARGGGDPFAPPSTSTDAGPDGTPEGGESGGSPDSLDEAVASRPADIPAEDWWLVGMEWVFDFDPGNPTPVPERLVLAWSDPKNSDVGEQAAGELSDAGKEAMRTFLTTSPPDLPRGELPPAEGVVFHAAAAARTANPAGSEPLYRVAVLWSASKDRLTGRPTVNRMTEVLFTGEPGNWRQVPCRSIAETACIPVFKEII